MTGNTSIAADMPPQTATILRPGATARVSSRVIAAAVAGNALEFYDFVTYAFFAVYIGKAFFPASTPMGSLLLSVAVFGVGFVSRPIGGIAIGAFADRAGRKPAMLLTMVLITLGTLALALTPSYASIGIAAPIIIVVCRLVQGLALGGEVGPSSAYLIESAAPHRRGLVSSWQLASQGAAIFAAGLFGAGLTALMPAAALQAWGWRLPFIVGLLLLPVGFYLRHSMTETLGEPPGDDGRDSAGAVIPQPGRVALAVLLVIGTTVSVYFGNFMTSYAITTLKMQPLAAMGATVVVGVVTLAFSLAGGWLADRYGRKPVMFWPRAATALLTVPALTLLIAHPTPAILFAVAGFLALLTAVSGAAVLVAILELFPTRTRATGLSIAYAVGVSLFGGSTQVVITWLIGATGSPAAPAWYVAAISAVTALAMLATPETRSRQA
jgi:MFS family permease